MKRIFINIVFAVAVMAFMACAQTETTDSGIAEQEVFDSWVKKYAPNAQPLGDSGIYYEVIEQAKNDAKAKVEVKGRWVKLNYVMRNLNGDIVYSRNEKTARQLGTHNLYTHYVPDILYVASQADKSGIPGGMYKAITTMNTGDMWKVYMPSKHGFSKSGYKITTGYGGQKGIEGGVPMILDSLQILDIIENPELKAQEDIDKLATASKPDGWGMRRNDTIIKGAYMEIMRRVSEKDTIVLNQSADIYYKVRFLDGQLINTNVDSVFYSHFGTVRTQDKTSAVKITRMNSNTSYNANQVPAKLFYALLPHLRYGDIGRVVVPPIYSYGKYYLHPNKTESSWEISTTFSFDGYYYDKYQTIDTDYYFGVNTFYLPGGGTTTAVPTAEIKPYTPLIYEFTVRRDSED